VNEVTMRITPMDQCLYDAPPGKTFVLGDTPVALSGLSAGFATPLSARLAFAAQPASESGTVIRDRAEATETIVDMINQDQAKRSSQVVVGPDPVILKALPRP
jgi:hypothetical protein